GFRDRHLDRVERKPNAKGPIGSIQIRGERRFGRRALTAPEIAARRANGTPNSDHGKAGLPAQIASALLVASCASITTRGSLPRSQKTGGCLASALLRRLGRGTVRCSRYLRARHENDDGYATGSRG